MALSVPSAKAPRSFCARGPYGAPLERVQIIKDWNENGKTRERIFEAGCASNAQISTGTDAAQLKGSVARPRVRL